MQIDELKKQRPRYLSESEKKEESKEESSKTLGWDTLVNDHYNKNHKVMIVLFFIPFMIASFYYRGFVSIRKFQKEREYYKT